MVEIYNGIVLSQKKKHEIRPLAGTWMGLESAILSEVSSEKGEYHTV